MLVAAHRARLVEGRELAGILERADHHAAVLGAGPPDERELPVVQDAHGRDEADRLPGQAPFEDRGAQLGDVAQYLHDQRRRERAGRSGRSGGCALR